MIVKLSMQYIDNDKTILSENSLFVEAGDGSWSLAGEKQR